MGDAPAQPEDRNVIVLKLYVAGNAPNSARARANLAEILRDLPSNLRYQLETIDVFSEPLRALQDGIFVTPTLAKVSPAPSEQIVGDLSDTARVKCALGLAGGAHGEA